MILEDDYEIEPSPSKDKDSLADAVTTANEEQYSSKTAAEIEAHGKISSIYVLQLTTPNS